MDVDSASESEDSVGWQRYCLPEVSLLSELCAKCYVENTPPDALITCLKGLPGVLVECMLPYLSARTLQALEESCQQKGVNTNDYWELHLEGQNKYINTSEPRWHANQAEPTPPAYHTYWARLALNLLMSLLTKRRNQEHPDYLEYESLGLHKIQEAVSDQFGCVSRVFVPLPDSRLLSYRKELERLVHFIERLGWLNLAEMEALIMDLHLLSLIQKHVKHLCLWINTCEDFEKNVLTAQVLVQTLMLYGKLEALSVAMLGGSTGTGVMQIIGAGPGEVFRQLLQVCAGITTHRLEDLIHMATRLGYSKPELLVNNPYNNELLTPQTAEEELEARGSNKRLYSSVVKSQDLRSFYERTDITHTNLADRNDAGSETIGQMYLANEAALKTETLNDAAVKTDSLNGAGHKTDSLNGTAIRNKRKRETDENSQEDANKRSKVDEENENAENSNLSPHTNTISKASSSQGLKSFMMANGQTLLLMFNASSSSARSSSIVSNYLPDILQHWSNLQALHLENTRLHISQSQPILDALCDKVTEGTLTTLSLDDNTALDYNISFLEKVLLCAVNRRSPMEKISMARLRLFLSGDWDFESSDLLQPFSGTCALNLSGCKLQTSACEFLRTVIKNDQALRSLNIDGCRLRDQELTPVMQAIAESGRLEKLNLGRILGLEQIDRTVFSDAIKSCSQLHSLDLSGCRLPEEFLCSEMFLSAVIDHPHLTSLSLQYNKSSLSSFGVLLNRIHSLPYCPKKGPKFTFLDLRFLPLLPANDVISAGERILAKGGSTVCICRTMYLSVDDHFMDNEEYNLCKRDIQTVYASLVHRVHIIL